MTDEEWTEYMVKFSKFNIMRDGHDPDGRYNGMKILTGYKGVKLIFSRLTMVSNVPNTWHREEWVNN